MSGSKVIKCKCEHEFQDKTYGKGMRLHSLSEDNYSAKCTVCGSEKNLRGGK